MAFMTRTSTLVGSPTRILVSAGKMEGRDSRSQIVVLQLSLDEGDEHLLLQRRLWRLHRSYSMQW